MRYLVNISQKIKASDPGSLIDRYWLALLGVIVFLLWATYTIGFWPGFMSYDSLRQLEQALGRVEYYDWHPPLMAWLWSVGIMITNKVGSMLAFQTALLWVALYLFAFLVYKITHKKRLSMLPILVGILPITAGISGVIWKDVHMSFALLLGTILILWIRHMNTINNVRVRYLLAGLVTVCLMYALLLRHNAVLAVLPLAFLLIASLTDRLKNRIIYLAGFLVAFAVIGWVVMLGLGVQKSNPTSAVMLDDVINVASIADIKSSSAPAELQAALLSVKAECARMDILVHSRFKCSDERERDTVQYTYYEELSRLWARVLFKNPFEYVSYRIATFRLFLFTPETYEYIHHSGIDVNELGQTVHSPGFAQSIHTYSYVTSRDFGILYRPYFWLVCSITLLVYATRQKRAPYRLVVGSLALSSALYIVGYFPLVMASDYRYVYWSVFAVLICFILIIVQGRKPARARRLKKRAT